MLKTLAALALLACATTAQATPNLAMVCNDPTVEGKLVSVDQCDTTPVKRAHFAPAGPNDLVRTCSNTSVSSVATQGLVCKSWTDPSYKWVRLSAVPAGGLVEGCRADIAVQAVGTTGGCTGAASGNTGWDHNGLIPVEQIAKAAAAPASAPVGQALLTWTAPTKNDDGSALTDLASYNVYEGTSSTSFAKVGGTNAGVTTFTWPIPTYGTYYFAVTALNAAGKESAMSAAVSKAVVQKIVTPGSPGTVTISVTVTAP